MARLIYYLIFLLFLSNCSVDTKSGIWKNTDAAKITKNLTDISFDYDLNYDQFKDNAIQYGKLSEFPKLDK